MKKISIFPWIKSFETGIKEIDEQHKSMVNLINKLAYYFLEEKEHNMKATFNELILYTHYHFNQEEKILEKYIKSEVILSSHKKGHDSFLPKIEKIKKTYQGNKLNEEILLFLIKWLAFHIIDEDKRLIYIVKALNKNEISSADITSNLIKRNSQEYNKQSLKILCFIWETTLRIKTIKKLKKINRSLKDILHSNYDELTGEIKN